MKGIIIAAGYGTRFLPCTKTIPKEMFPLVDTPAIEFIVDEFVKSGITDILIVSSRRKKTLEDYFDREIELESVFYNEGKQKSIDQISKFNNYNIYFLRQKKMNGTGHAILSCKNFIGNSPFVVAYPDDLIFSDYPLSKVLIDEFNKSGNSVLSVQQVEGDVSRYGVIDPENGCNKGSYRVKKLIEKPVVGTEPSKLISIGRYLFTSEIINILEENYKNHKSGEFYHVDSINQLALEGKVSAVEISGLRIDVGDKAGYIEGILRYAMLRDDLKNETISIMKKLLSEK